ncbi:hypothetical protein [Myxacorys almedinensis]|uniref:Uncharacterized protein n=1 Tax=Myxacorys almedinensis A TaxID=2690445 RepID=A0A8J7Z929_9CYAN|nr:hypothetical protein [Myxacorys almedinensis]NDJ18673.1 hypothetical protein [Myxacorys almedinensis A]
MANPTVFQLRFFGVTTRFVIAIAPSVGITEGRSRNLLSAKFVASSLRSGSERQFWLRTVGESHKLGAGIDYEYNVRQSERPSKRGCGNTVAIGA